MPPEKAITVQLDKKSLQKAAQEAMRNDIFHKRYNGLIRHLRKEYGILAHERSVGFIRIGDHEYQLFFKACLFDKDLLKADPLSGGLVVESQRRKKCRKGKRAA